VYVELSGNWIGGPTDPTIPTRVPVQINWPQKEGGTISLVLKDENGAPVALDFTAGESATLSIGIATAQGSLKRFKATQQGDIGRYLFTIPIDAFIDLSGPLIYDVTVVRVISAVTYRQAVLPLAYWVLQATAFDGVAT